MFEDPVSTIAHDKFGIDYLFPYQRLVIANVLDAASADSEIMRQIVLLPTGFGKSLCFQLPALMLEGITVVAYPLLALMDDQQRRLKCAGIEAVLLRGGQTPEERQHIRSALQSGAVRIIISNPETLLTQAAQSLLAGTSVAHFAIDEAHCISEWGETFRPAYLELAKVCAVLKPKAISAFTATASPTVFKAIADRLFGADDFRLISGDPDRVNIHYSVQHTLNPDKSVARLAASMHKPMIIFAGSRKNTMMLSQFLRTKLQSREIYFYHAGLEKSEKHKIEEWFFLSNDGILVSTCAYGMGVDKKNIRSVVHYNVPASVEAYLQEAGRAGRDGLPSRAVLLRPRGCGWELLQQGKALASARQQAMLAYADSRAGCRRMQLLDLLGYPDENRSPCAGCDRCDNSEAVCEGLPEAYTIVQSNPRRMNLGHAAALLTTSQFPRACRGASLLSTWTAEEAKYALESAIAEGWLARIEKGPWKGRLTISKEQHNKIAEEFNVQDVRYW